MKKKNQQMQPCDLQIKGSLHIKSIEKFKRSLRELGAAPGGTGRA